MAFEKEIKEYEDLRGKYQTLIINGRYVINYMISSAISNVYEDYLMKGKFPLYVLCLDLPVDEVDVNVHPNKLEVKFEIRSSA